MEKGPKFKVGDYVLVSKDYVRGMSDSRVQYYGEITNVIPPMKQTNNKFLYVIYSEDLVISHVEDEEHISHASNPQDDVEAIMTVDTVVVLGRNWKAYKQWFEKNKDFEWENPTFEGMLDWLVEQEEK